MYKFLHGFWRDADTVIVGYDVCVLLPYDHYELTVTLKVQGMKWLRLTGVIDDVLERRGCIYLLCFEASFSWACFQSIACGSMLLALPHSFYTNLLY